MPIDGTCGCCLDGGYVVDGVCVACGWGDLNHRNAMNPFYALVPATLLTIAINTVTALRALVPASVVTDRVATDAGLLLAALQSAQQENKDGSAWRSNE